MNAPKLRGYASAPPTAWAGWRLRIPGEPEGGQYHGYTAGLEHGGSPRYHPLSGSEGPWSNVWGGTAQREGETVSDYVYRGPAEIRPRPNASGGVNTVRSLQTSRSAGYAESPGNRRGLGVIVNPTPIAIAQQAPGCGPAGYYEDISGNCSNVPGRTPMSLANLADPNTAYFAIMPDGSKAYVPAGQPIPAGAIRFVPYGATATVPQPPPPTQPGGTLVAASIPPVSPAPAPTVAAPAGAYLPSQGQSVPGITPAATDLTTWLTSSTLLPSLGMANWVPLAAVAAFFLFSGKGGRK